MASIEFNSSTRSIKDLVANRKIDRIRVPEHQRRSVVWKPKRRVEFIDSCKKGLPFPSILLFKDETDVCWLEDGLQRITTLSDFMDDKFEDLDKLKFSEWPEVTQRLFEKYPVPTLTYSGATEAQRVEIFDRFQNGSPLNVGERLHSLGYTPLVSFTKRMLLKDDKEDAVSGEFFERAQNVWGTINIGEEKDKRYNQLCVFVALMNGVVYGCNIAGGGISKKYDDLRKQILEKITPEMETDAKKVLIELFSIYEHADTRKSILGWKKSEQNKIKRAQKNIGNFTGAIVYSLKQFPDEWERLHTGWVDFLVAFRENNDLLEEKILSRVTSARSWNLARWETTYKSVFNVEDVPVVVRTSDDETEDDEE